MEHRGKVRGLFFFSANTCECCWLLQVKVIFVVACHRVILQYMSTPLFPSVLTWNFQISIRCGPFTRYVKLWVSHAPECRERFPRHCGLVIPACAAAHAWPLSDKKPWVSCQIAVTHVPWCKPGSLTSGFLRGGRRVEGWGGGRSRIPGACPTRNFAHLVRGPMKALDYFQKIVRERVTGVICLIRCYVRIFTKL